MERVVLCVLLILSVDCALKKRREPLEWDYRSDAEKVNMRGCANLTNVLDNWRFAIVTQFRNLLLYDHHSVLPDYGRIKPLSDALDDLYKEFNALKERLGELTSRCDSMEASVEQMSAGRHTQPVRPPAVADRSSNVPPLQLKPGILSSYGTQRRRVKKGKSPGNPSETPKTSEPGASG